MYAVTLLPMSHPVSIILDLAIRIFMARNEEWIGSHGSGGIGRFSVQEGNADVET